MAEHVPATLHFSNVSYTIGGKKVLDNISGALKPGQVMAIMGASGAGKSTFLDILARKSKRGNVEGKILVNGAELSDGQYRRLIGFVDQEDTLMGTLTVYETVLYSAMLRLPREMSVEAKKIRTLETMEELGILGIRGSRIGEAGRRSISGGEKRRVSIACELVTSPSILFLDEPTSGLDAFNAINVVESLVALARNYRRTVVFTIHQPRSNIVALFDQLVLLARGKLVYGGPAPACQTYFESVGYPCPAGFNIADFLVDLTMQDNGSSSEAPPSRDEVEAQAPRGRVNNESEGGTELRSRGSSPRRVGSLRSWASRTFGSTKAQDGEVEISERVSTLVRAFAASEINATTQNEIRSASQIRGSVNGGTGDGGGASFGGYRKASLWTQFTILSGRAFRNLYRNPMLMLAHYLLAIVLARKLACLALPAHQTDAFIPSHLRRSLPRSDPGHRRVPGTDGPLLFRVGALWLFFLDVYRRVFKRTDPLHARTVERLLLPGHLLRLQGPVRRHPATGGAPLHPWRDHLPPRRSRPDRGAILAISADPHHLQPRRFQRRAAHQHRDRRYWHSESGRQPGDALQVSLQIESLDYFAEPFPRAVCFSLVS